MFGYIIKTSEGNYIVNVDPDERGSGYGVVPKEIDPYCKYDFDKVAKYYKDNPDKHLDEEYSIIGSDIPQEDVVRAERDNLIQQIEWRVNRHYQELELDLTPTEELRPLLEYIQALRDVPQQEGFPNNITWPEVPV